MEGLRIVHDGSAGFNRLGYHMLEVTALTPEHKAQIGVYSRVFSAAEAMCVCKRYRISAESAAIPADAYQEEQCSCIRSRV